MGNVIAIIQAINTLIPLILQTIKVIEDAMPDGGQGEAKLELLRTIISGAYEQQQSLMVSFEKLWPLLKPIVDGLVAMCNASGKFKKG